MSDPTPHSSPECEDVQEAAGESRPRASEASGGSIGDKLAVDLADQGKGEKSGSTQGEKALRENAPLSALPPKLIRFGKGVGKIGEEWFLHDHSRSSAALAFYSLFSIVPLLVILTKLVGILVGDEAAQTEITATTAMFLDKESSKYLLDLVKEQSAPAWTGWMSLLAFGVLLVTASKVVVELRDVLALIFGVRARPGRRGWVVNFLLNRGVPILLILLLGIVIAISAMAAAFFHLFVAVYAHSYSEMALWKWTGQVGAVALLTLIFTFVLRWLPPAPPSFRAAAGGALVASLLLAGLRGLMSLYFQSAGVTTVYGAAVTLVVVLLWIYFSVQIFFVGAEAAGLFERKWSKRREPLDLINP